MHHSNMLLIRAATHNYFHYRLICRRFKDIQLTLFSLIQLRYKRVCIWNLVMVLKSEHGKDG